MQLPQSWASFLDAHHYVFIIAQYATKLMLAQLGTRTRYWKCRPAGQFFEGYPHGKGYQIKLYQELLVESAKNYLQLSWTFVIIWHSYIYIFFAKLRFLIINSIQSRLPIQIIIKMRRTESEVMRNNHHSLNRKQSPLSLHSSKNDSMAKPRKMSNASLKQNIPDLEKLIMDIKISPMPDSNLENIKHIYRSLKQLESNALVSDEVHAVYLLMQSIQNKLTPNNRMKYRPAPSLASKASSVSTDNKQLSQVSPIKQINEQTSSRILYTNLSLKDIERSISEQSSLMQSAKKSGVKVAVSKFEESDHNSEVEKLNNQIQYLQKLLANKTKGSAVVTDLGLFKKKSCRY